MIVNHTEDLLPKQNNNNEKRYIDLVVPDTPTRNIISSQVSSSYLTPKTIITSRYNERVKIQFIEKINPPVQT